MSCGMLCGVQPHHPSPPSGAAIVHLVSVGAGMASDGNGFMYVADFANDRVVKLDAAKSPAKTYTVGDGPLSLAMKR